MCDRESIHHTTVYTVILWLRCHTPCTVLRLVHFTPVTVMARSSILPYLDGRIRIQTVQSPTLESFLSLSQSQRRDTNHELYNIGNIMYVFVKSYTLVLLYN